VPEFPGGLDALGSFLGKNIRYPKSARDKGIQGKVIATFVVEKNGSLSDVRIARGVSKDIDDESLRVLRLSPNWKPGIQDKRKVRVQYSIPISFTLADNIGKSTPNKTDAVFTSVEQVPEFPGGLNEFGHFLAVNIKYPKTDREKGIQGKVIVTFVVEEDGSLSGLKVTRGVSKGLDDESVRVLKLSPNWKPGIQNGRKVRVQYSVPINFSLATDDKKSEKPTENKMGAVQEGTATNNLYASTGVRDSSSSVERVVIKGGLTQQPLYIVDGKEVSGSHFKQMDASTIESINVLKDKTATTIYGYKGVNGVIIVTSKNPKAN
jgi:TonB family protein